MSRRVVVQVSLLFSIAIGAALVTASGPEPPQREGSSVLDRHLLVTWYGNPHSTRMGILGEQSGQARAEGLRKQASAYAGISGKPVLMAYHLVATVAQCTAGPDGEWRRRESTALIQSMLTEARAHGFKLILDIQPGRSRVLEEVVALRPFLEEPDVYLAIDPEFTMTECQQPGREIGRLTAADVNAALAEMEAAIGRRHLPPKVLILHQFRLDMLPDKHRIGPSPNVDVVLNMDGFGSPSLKRSSYRAVMRQGALEFPGIKLFYRQDTALLSPSQVLALVPQPALVVYQ
jgi:hypothetical protein